MRRIRGLWAEATQTSEMNLFQTKIIKKLQIQLVPVVFLRIRHLKLLHRFKTIYLISQDLIPLKHVLPLSKLASKSSNLNQSKDKLHSGQPFRTRRHRLGSLDNSLILKQKRKLINNLILNKRQNWIHSLTLISICLISFLCLLTHVSPILMVKWIQIGALANKTPKDPK